MKTVNVKGPIVSSNESWIYEWLGMEHTSTKTVNRELKEANGEDIEVLVNSGGGSVTVGSEIYTLIKSYTGDVLIKILGMAGSAASVVCMARKCLMTPTGQLMIHNALMDNRGDYRSMDKASQILQTVNESIANAYRLKTGKTNDELKILMDEESWFTAQRAKELGFIDGIMFEDEGEIDFKNSCSQYETNNKIIDKLKELGSVENIKKYILENKIKNSGDITNNIEPEFFNKNISGKGEGEKMTLEQFKNENPDLYNQIVNQAKEEGKAEGKKEGITAERERIKSIEDLAIPGNEELINKAKFETGITAEAVAVEIIKAQKEKGSNYLAASHEDAEPLNNVTSEETPEGNNSSEVQDKEASNFMAKYMNGEVK